MEAEVKTSEMCASLERNLLRGREGYLGTVKCTPRSLTMDSCPELQPGSQGKILGPLKLLRLAYKCFSEGLISLLT